MELPPDDRPRFLSEADCHEIATRLTRYAKGGGYTLVAIASTWRGNVRWARNQISTAGEARDCQVTVCRDLDGAANQGIVINDVTDDALVAAARRGERLAVLDPVKPESDLVGILFRPEPLSPVAPQFFDATYQLDASRRAVAARSLMQSATNAGMLSAGYLEVAAHSLAFITSWGYARYFQWTDAQYSVTVRDPKGVGSGWAGVDWPDWNRIDGAHLSAVAVEKCLTSRNPVVVEPGRYTTILEPQAVCDFVGQMLSKDHFYSRAAHETDQRAAFHKSGKDEPPAGRGPTLGLSRLGERVVDERISLGADPADPDLSFPPFAAQEFAVESDGYIDLRVDTYHPVMWITQGVLTQLPEDRDYAVHYLNRPTGQYNSGAFRMTGGDTSLAEMIATTKRGILVTRFDQVTVLDEYSWLCQGYTRDGLWLIEHGAISKPIKNFEFVESVLFALNNVEQLGPAQRVFRPASRMNPWLNPLWLTPQPVIVPPLKVRDFSFTALSEAI